MLKCIGIALFLSMSPAMCIERPPQSFNGTSNSWAPWETDKKLHVLWGAMIGAPAYCLAERLGYKYPILHSIFWTALAGYLKEKYDSKHGGRGEWADMGNTVLGGILVSIPIRLSKPKDKTFAIAQPLEDQYIYYSGAVITLPKP